MQISDGFRIYRCVDRDFDGVPFAPERNNAPLYALYEIVNDVSIEEGKEVHRFKIVGPPLATFDSFLEEDPDPVKFFNKILTEAQHCINLPIEEFPDEWKEPSSPGYYDMEGAFINGKPFYQATQEERDAVMRVINHPMNCPDCAIIHKLSAHAP